MSNWYQLKTLDGCTSSVMPMREFRDRIKTALCIPHMGNMASWDFPVDFPMSEAWSREYEFRALRVEEFGQVYEFQEVWPKKNGA